MIFIHFISHDNRHVIFKNNLIKHRELFNERVKKMKIGPMTKNGAQEINTWVNENPYELYSFSGEERDMNELLDGSYFTCFDSNGELIGYFCFGKNAQVPGGYKAGLYNRNNSLDIGLEMKPSLVGQGWQGVSRTWIKLWKNKV